MRTAVVMSILAVLSRAASGQSAAPQPAFAAASVKPSERLAGPDANNRFAF